MITNSAYAATMPDRLYFLDDLSATAVDETSQHWPYGKYEGSFDQTDIIACYPFGVHSPRLPSHWKGSTSAVRSGVKRADPYERHDYI